VKATRRQRCAGVSLRSHVPAGSPDLHSTRSTRRSVRPSAGLLGSTGPPARRAAALTTAEVKRLSRACGTDLAGARDRALFLVGFAGALRRSELVALDLPRKLLNHLKKWDGRQFRTAERVREPHGEEICTANRFNQVIRQLPVTIKPIAQRSDQRLQVPGGAEQLCAVVAQTRFHGDPYVFSKPHLTIDALR